MSQNVGIRGAQAVRGRSASTVFTTVAVLTCLSVASCGQAETDARESSVPAQQEQEVAAFSVTLKPTLGADKEVDAIEVSGVMNGGLAEGEGRLKLMAPVVYANVEHIADRIMNLSVTDSDGPVEFTIEDDDPAPGGYPYFRHWTATRDVSFPVNIRYRALVQPPGGPRGPAFGIRPSAGGISGAGAGFMLVPVNVKSETSQLNWDLSSFERPSVGVTTFGEDKVKVDGPPANIIQGWYMAGPAEYYPSGDAESDFHAYWLGDFPFDEQAAMAFTSHMYDYFEQYFDHLDPAPEYRVFMRLMETKPYGGGTALANSFMLSRGPARPEELDDRDGPRSTLAHELLHQWTGSLVGHPIQTNWFSEGLTTYYEYTLPFKAGEISLEQYVAGLNHLSEMYYTNPSRDGSIEEIMKVGFGNDVVRHVPYQRGALYFADLDARLKHASHGESGLHEFMKDVFAARESGEVDLTVDAWSGFVSKALGQDEAIFVQKLHEDGMTLYPDPESFGPCITGERVTKDIDGQSYDLMEWRIVPDVSVEVCREKL
ncbi:hypothetical protein HY29_01135 [Hyphomonas beringensis]|uniref:Peptidase M1 membrane alanine aminopeptidase domain-containing protein n=1 Tax=Hyphomonas beringensis TaxID=1280946 RepID=A0A062UML8_9PROT|nr:M1 family aminopeptidase [Hyphomonas beringensis]KCZ57360.1 hypothetical protein HY29_01135 [Hyphomonas beringensis]